MGSNNKRASQQPNFCQLRARQTGACHPARLHRWLGLHSAGRRASRYFHSPWSKAQSQDWIKEDGLCAKTHEVIATQCGLMQMVALLSRVGRFLSSLDQSIWCGQQEPSFLCFLALIVNCKSNLEISCGFHSRGRSHFARSSFQCLSTPLS